MQIRGPSRGEMVNVARFEQVSKSYRNFWGRRQQPALKDLDLQIARGEVVGLLGPNGSGKTTAIKLLVGLLFPDKGRLQLFDGSPADARQRARLGYLPENNQLLPFLNAEESLDFQARLRGLDRKQRSQRVPALLERLGMLRARRQRCDTFSKGMARRLALAQALVGDPEMLVLDEPTSGLDPLGTRDFKELLREQKDRGTTCLLCSHLLSEIELVCDRVVILYQGDKIREGTLSGLLDDPDRVLLTLRKPGKGLVERLVELARGASEEVQNAPYKRSLEELFVASLADVGGRHEGDAFGAAGGNDAPARGDTA